MSKEIKEYDEKGNLIYEKDSSGFEKWRKFDENNNRIYFKNSKGYDYWSEYDENNNEIYWKDSDGIEDWKKVGEFGYCIGITEQEYNDIKFRKKEKEYNSRTKCSRFELMDI